MGFDGALIFTRIMEYHSSTQAAQSLGMQRSTVSRRITLLEERLDVRLLNRTARKLRLTEVGQAYYERCRQVMHDLAETEQVVMQLQQTPSGLLRIASPIEFGRMFPISLPGDSMRQYPRITAEVEPASCSVDPLQGGVDIMIMVGQPKDSTLMARRLLSISRRFCTSLNYLVTYGTPTSVAELTRHRAAPLPTDSQRYWPLSGDSLSYQRVLSCNNITFACEAVIAGIDVVALLMLVCMESVHSGRLVRLLTDVSSPVDELYAVYPSWHFQVMKAKAFLDFLISRLPADIGRLLKPEAIRLITSRL